MVPLTYTVSEAAQRAGVSEATLRKAIAAGQIPCIRLGRRILIPRAKFDQMLSEGYWGDEADY